VNSFREAVFCILNHYPESLKESYLESPSQLTKDLDLLKTFVKYGIEIDATLPLQNHDLDLIRLLAEKGANLSEKAGQFYLEQFIQDNFKEGIDFLLPKIKESMHALLASAILDGRSIDIVDNLIQHPYMDLQQSSIYGSPLFAAILKKNLPAVNTLLAKSSAYFPR
jgi:hypothetical protein